MKIKALFTSCAVLVMACASNDLSQTILSGTLDSESVLTTDQEIVYHDSSNEIKIGVISIQEGRCPSDVTCIQQGFVSVSFRIVSTSESVTLITPPQITSHLSSSHTFVYSGSKYRLQLKDVTPYPARDNTKERKSAVFNLERVE